MRRLQVTAPARADIAGGTLDIWPLNLILERKARTINTTLDIKTKVRAITSEEWSLESSGVVEKFKIPFFETDLKLKHAFLQFPMKVIHDFDHFLSSLKDVPPHHIEITSEIPQSSGLGGSSVLATALLILLYELKGEYQDSKQFHTDLALAVRDIEASFLKAPTGIQDQLAPLFGGINVFQFNTSQLSSHTYPDQHLEELKKRTLVIHSEETHQSGLSNWQVFQKALNKDIPVLEALKVIARVAEQMNNILMSDEIDWQKAGYLLLQDWKTRESQFGVSTPRLSLISQTLDRLKPFGYRVCGAAQGGCFLILCEENKKENIKESLKKENILVLDTAPCADRVEVTSE